MTKKILMLGDVVGAAGKRALFYNLQNYKQQQHIDLSIVNGENVEDGFGISPALALDLFTYGVDVITTGNHVWKNEEVYPLLDSNDRLLRPHNYPSPAPGKGYTLINVKGTKMAVINLQGRVRMGNMIECPFKIGAALVKKLRQETPFIFIDFHAEDTAEREALAFYFDGLVTAVVGTHTHVQTADETILPQGTAHLGDLGMCGATNSVIGSYPERSIERALSQMPLKMEIVDGEAMLSGAIITADDNGKALAIERVNLQC